MKPLLSDQIQVATHLFNIIESIINGLAQVPFEGVLVEAFNGTRKKTQYEI